MGVSGTAGTANRGGGGGAGMNDGTNRSTSGGGNGGSGIVILAYPDTYPALTTIGGGLTYTQPTRTGYRVYQFTAGTGTVTV
jgi:hypothetical protein